MMSNLWTVIKRNAGSILFTVVALALVLVGVGITIEIWSWLRMNGATAASNGDTLRNAGILIGGAIAFVFGLWRSWLAGRQASAAQDQAGAARSQVEASQVQIEAVQRQVEIAQAGLLNERYRHGAEMLSSNILTARLGGIFALQQLWEEHAEQYQFQMLRLFCAFVRDPDGDWDAWTSRRVFPEGVLHHSLRQDVQAAVEAISDILTRGVAGDSEGPFRADLRWARLNGIHLEGGDLSGVDFAHAALVRADLESTSLWGAQLRMVQLQDSNLRRTNLSRATISSADLTDVDFSDAILNGTYVFSSNLDGAKFDGAALAGTIFSKTAVTQAQLDQTRPDPQNPPKFLDDPIDRSTGKPLQWHGEPLAQIH